MTEPGESINAAWETTCPSCRDWQDDPRSGMFNAGCDDCLARAVAQSPAAWKAAKGITATELQDVMVHTFGHEHMDAWKRRVWAWMKRLKVGGLAS